MVNRARPLLRSGGLSDSFFLTEPSILKFLIAALQNLQNKSQEEADFTQDHP